MLFCSDLIQYKFPPDGTGQDDAQSLAMQLMRNTYEDATAVLVLDVWLLSSISIGQSDTEKLMRIFCCIWNTRL